MIGARFITDPAWRAPPLLQPSLSPTKSGSAQPNAKMTKAFDDVFWHDGNLVDVLFNIDMKGASSITIRAHIYKDQNAPSRDLYEISCKGVSRFNIALDCDELKSNMFAGHVSHGYLKDKALWVYFTDGLIEIRAKTFRLKIAEAGI